jgi:hypothetical protein
LSGGSIKKITGSVKKSLSSSATAKIASAPAPVNVVSPLDSKSSQKKKIGIPFVKSRGKKSQRNTISTINLPSNLTQKYKFKTHFRSSLDSP